MFRNIILSSKNLPLAQFLACSCDVFHHLLIICLFHLVYSNFCYITFSYAGKYLVFFFCPLDLWLLDVSILFDYKFVVLCCLHAIPLNLSHLSTTATVVNIVLKVTGIKSFINCMHVILNWIITNNTYMLSFTAPLFVQQRSLPSVTESTLKLLVVQ